MDLFILGAGASRGVLSGDDFVPTADEFGEILCRVKPNWPTEYSALCKVVEHLSLRRDKWNLEKVWSCLDWYAKLEHALPLPRPWNDESRQIKKALLTVYGERCDNFAEVAKNSTLANILRDDVKAGDTLVSFNYDTIAERLAAKLGQQLDARPRSGVGVAFAKPHGSASWTLDQSKQAIDWLSLDGSPLVTSLKVEHVDVGREPLVLGTVPIKSELIREVQAACGMLSIYDVVASQWRVLVEAVRDAKRIVLVGYRFPAEDLYGRFLIREGLLLRGGNPIAVQFYEKITEQNKVCCEIEKVFGEYATSIEYKGCVKHAA